MLGHGVAIKIAGGQVVVRVWTDDREAAIAEAKKMVREMGHEPLAVLECWAGENCGAERRF